MKNRFLQMKRMKQAILLVALLSMAGMTKCFADDYDFSAVCSTGQTMYYKITDNTSHEVQLTYPNRYSYTTSGDVGLGYWGTYTVTSYWYNYTKPTGDIIVPDCIVYNEISYSVTSIRENTFYDGCTGITSIVIPSTVSSIGNDAFRSCSGLTEMTVLAETPPTLGGSNVFYNVNKNIPVTVPCGSVESYQNTSVWNVFTNWQCETGTDFFSINATSNPTEGGTITGAGTYFEGQTCTLFSTANEGYTFTNWMENGSVVSTSTSYTFTVNRNRTLTANFAMIVPGTISGKFTVSDCAQVYFSQGNLQYQASTDTWKFAEHQWDAIGTENANISPSYDGWIDLFGWGTGDNPTNTSTNGSDYTTFTDWGVNPISNGGNMTNQWRTLTKDEFGYLLFNRITSSGIRFAKAKVNSVAGVIILPDDWNSTYYTLSNANNSEAAFNVNTITLANWTSKFETHGAVFLPASGLRDGTLVHYVGTQGKYWTSTRYSSNSIIYNFLDFGGSSLTVDMWSGYAHSVRLVRKVSSFVYYSVDATSNIVEGGTVSGAGNYEQCDICTLTAVPANGYRFGYWTENGEVVSSNASYSFAVSDNRDLVANFMPQGNAPTGAFDALFTISDTVKVYFSQGNLQYQASSNMWRFAEHQWDYVGNNTLGTVYENGVKSDNAMISSTYNGWIDLFGWGTGNTPTNTSTSTSDYSVFTDWGSNSISNGGDTANQWRTLSYDEWRYLLKTRNTSSGMRYTKATVNGIAGLIILPDDWDNLYYVFANTDDEDVDFTVNTIDLDDWNSELETHGAIFLPAAGRRSGTSVFYVGTNGGYWSSTYRYLLSFSENHATANSQTGCTTGYSIRLACPLPNITYYSITATAEPTEGGTVNGSGTYQQGHTCTLTATPAEGYTFVNWTENGEEVSTEATFSFMVTGDRTLVANFIVQDNTPTGAINGKFTINENGDQVYFSQGNLQYQASSSTWRFAENQWGYVGNNNSNISQTYDEWIDLLGWGTSGWDSGNTYYHPWDSDNSDNTLYGPLDLYSLNGNFANADWGVYNAISNGGDHAKLWRTLTQEEWTYLLYTRDTDSGIRFAKAKVNNVMGIILLPNDWSDSCYVLNNTDQNEASFTSNVISALQWASLEEHGAVFLPAAGGRYGTSVVYSGSLGRYWTANPYDDEEAWFVNFYNSGLGYGNSNLSTDAHISRSDGCAVRLVQPATSHQINAVPNPAEGGTVIGADYYEFGTIATLTAMPAEGYYFLNWTQDGEEVSTNVSYSFTVFDDMNLVANFAKGYLIGDGGDATNVYLPSYSYYKYTLSQQIYTAEELGVDGVINSIAFYNGGAEKTRVYDFYLKSTTKSAFSSNTDWEVVSDADKVFSDSVTMAANAWTVITFDTPFVYDGVSNLVLVTDDNTGDWTNSPHMACRVFNALNQAIRVYSDNTDYDPMSPPTSYVSNDHAAVQSEKNQIIFGIIPAFHFVTSGTWDNATNWNRGILPSMEDIVYIDASCQLNQNVEVAELTVTEGQTLTLQSGNTLTVTGNLINTLPEGLIIEDGAQLMHASDNVSATVKKNIEGHGTIKGKYYLISNPLVSIVNPEQANIYHLTRGNYDLYDWLAGSADSLEWRNFKDFSFMMYPEGYGYLYANQGGVELLFPGVIRRSDIGFGKSVSCVADEVFHFNGWNLIGNPFVCDAILVDANNEPLPFYRMNAAGNGFEAVAPGTPIAPMEGVFYKASVNGVVYFVRAD